MWNRALILITGLTVPMVTMSAYSFYVGRLFGYNPALGRYHAAPWSWFVWGVQYYGQHPWILKYGLVTFVAAALGTASLITILLYRVRSGGVDEDLHGEARFATEREVQELHMLVPQKKGPENGLILGAFNDSYVQHQSNEHAIVFAPTRAGKGVSIVIPTLLSWRESVVVIDIKGELWETTAGWRKHQAGNKVVKLDFTDDSPGAARFNPLEEIRLGSKKVTQDVSNFVGSLIGEASQGPHGHWDREANGFLCALILHTLYRFKKDKQSVPTLDDVYSTLNSLEKKGNELYEEMLTYPHLTVKSCVYIAREAKAMLEKADEEQRGVRSTVNGHLKPFTEPLLSATTRESTFRIADLMDQQQPVSLYCVVPPSDIARLMPLVRMLIELVAMRNMERLPEKGKPIRRMLFLLDEFPALGKVAIFEKALAYMAGYGMQALIITQDKSQIDRIYGQDNTIIPNCFIRVVYAPNDLKTARWISEMLGYRTVIQETNQVSGKRGDVTLKNVSVSHVHTKRALLLPEEVMRLPGLRKDAQGKVCAPGEMIIFVTNQRPIKVNHILYFKDPTFQERASFGAPRISDVILLRFEGRSKEKAA